MLYIFEDFTRDQQVLDDLFQRPQPSNVIVELQSNLSASSFCSCRGKRSGKRLLHWLNEQACTVGVRNRTQKILRISLPLTNMSLTSKFEVYLSQTCHWYQTGSFLTSMKLGICTHETLNLHWRRLGCNFFPNKYSMSAGGALKALVLRRWSIQGSWQTKLSAK